MQKLLHMNNFVTGGRLVTTGYGPYGVFVDLNAKQEAWGDNNVSCMYLDWNRTMYSVQTEMDFHDVTSEYSFVHIVVYVEGTGRYSMDCNEKESMKHHLNQWTLKNIDNLLGEVIFLRVGSLIHYVLYSGRYFGEFICPSQTTRNESRNQLLSLLEISELDTNECLPPKKRRVS